MTHINYDDSDSKSSKLHMLGHGLDVSALPHHQEHFLRASEKDDDKKELEDKHRLMLAMLADMVLGIPQNKSNTGSSILSYIGDFLKDLFDNDIPIEEKFSRANERFGTPSYEKFSQVDFSGNADFDQAVEFVLEREGVLSNHKNDRGGLTKYGISQKANPDVDVANLSREDAIGIYKDRYWDSIGADNMDMATALIAFDTSVNSGPGAARKMLAQTGGNVENMLDWRKDNYERIVSNDSSQGVFLNGWMNRLDHLSDAVAGISNRDDIKVATATPVPTLGLS